MISYNFDPPGRLTWMFFPLINDLYTTNTKRRARLLVSGYSAELVVGIVVIIVREF